MSKRGLSRVYFSIDGPIQGSFLPTTKTMALDELQEAAYEKAAAELKSIVQECAQASEELEQAFRNALQKWETCMTQLAIKRVDTLSLIDKSFPHFAFALEKNSAYRVVVPPELTLRLSGVTICYDEKDVQQSVHALDECTKAPVRSYKLLVVSISS